MEVEPLTLRSWRCKNDALTQHAAEPLGHAAVLHQNMIEIGKLTRPGQTNLSEKQNSKGTTRSLAVLLFVYISLSCVNFLFLIML